MNNHHISESSLPSVIDLMTSETPSSHKCSLCDLFFKTSEALSSHLYLTNKKNCILANPYKKTHSSLICTLCSQKFDSSQGLNQHIGKKHLSQKTVFCSICEKGFKHKHAVNFHIRQVHEKSARADCKYCNKNFYNAYTARKHMKKCRGRFPSFPISFK